MLCPIHVFRSGPPRSPRLSSRSRCTPPSPSTRYGGARSDAQPLPGVAGGEGGRVLPAHRPPSSQLALHFTDPHHPTPAVLCTLFGAHASLDADWCPRPRPMMVIVITDQPSRGATSTHCVVGGRREGRRRGTRVEGMVGARAPCVAVRGDDQGSGGTAAAASSSRGLGAFGWRLAVRRSLVQRCSGDGEIESMADRERG